MCSFLWLSSIPLYICTTATLSVHPVDGHLGCFHVLSIIYSAAMNTGVHVSFSVLVFPGYMPRSSIARLYGGFISSFLRNLHTLFHNGCIYLHIVFHCACTNLHSHQQYKKRFLFSQYSPSPARVISCLFGNSHSDRWEVIFHEDFDLTDFWLMTLRILSCTICVSSLGECLFRNSAYFIYFLLFIYLFIFWNSAYFKIRLFFSCWIV